MIPVDIKSKIAELKQQYKDSLDKANKSILLLENEKKNLLSEKEEVIKLLEQKEKEKIIALKNLNEAIDKLPSLEKDIEKYKLDIEIIKKESQLKDNEVNELTQKLKETIEQNKINLNKVTLIANKRKELVENFQKKSEESEANILKLQEEKNNLISKIASIDIHVKNLESQLQEFELKNDDLENKNNISIEQLKSVTEKYNTSEEKIIKLEGELKTKSFELDETILLKDKISNDFDRLQNRFYELEEESTKLKLEIDNLNNKIEDLILKINIIEKENNDKSEKIDSLLNESNNKDNKIKILLEENNNKESEIKLLSSEKESIKNKLDFINEEKDKYSLDLEVTKEQLFNIKEEKEILDKEISNLKLNLKNSEEKVSEIDLVLKNTVEDFELKIEIKEKELFAINKNLEEEIKERANLSNQNNSLKSQLDNINKELFEYKNQYTEISSKFIQEESDKEEIFIENQKLLSKVDELTQSLKDVSLNNETLKISEKNLEEQLNKFRLNKNSETERLSKEIESLISENSILKLNSSKKEAELEISKQDVESLKKLLENLKNDSFRTEKDSISIETSNLELKNKLSQKDRLIEELQNESNVLKVKLEETITHKSEEIKELTKKISFLNETILNSSSQSSETSPETTSYYTSKIENLSKTISEKEYQLAELRNSNEQLKNGINSLKNQTKNISSENDHVNNQNKILIDNLKAEIEVLKNRNMINEDEINSYKKVSESLKLENKKLTDRLENITSSQLRDNKSQSIEIDDSLKIKLEEKDYISIDELYKTATSYNSQKENDSLNDKDEEDKKVDFDINRLEFYQDIVEEKDEIDNSIPKKQAPKVNINNSAMNFKKADSSLEHVEESLNYIQSNKKTKQQKNENTLFILGGNKDLEDNWKIEIEKFLQEYGLTHSWISETDKEHLRGLGKGVVFLISPLSAHFVENAELIMRGSSLPSIKHTQTNLTKLKIDIIDNFIRRK